MPTTESDLIQAALKLPNGLFEFLDKPIPEIEAIASPSTVEDAQIAMGKLSANINTIMEAFVGLKPVQLQLRLSQYHPSIIGMLCGGLEFIGGGGTIQIVAPKDGSMHPGYFDAWLIEASEDFESVSVTCGDDTFELDKNGTQWSKNWPIAMGQWTATVIGMKADESTVEATTSFSVVSYSVLETIVTPVDEETQEVEFRYELSEEGVAESGEITITDGVNTWNVVLAITGLIAAGVATLPVSATVVTVAGVIGLATEAQLLINQYTANF